jgi:signal transduction histidine kinase
MNTSAQSRSGPGPIAWKAWAAIWAAGLLGIFAAVAGAWLGLTVPRVDSPNASAAMYTLLDTGSALEEEIGRIVRPAIQRTEILARDPALIQALASGDPAAQTALLNSKITTATEIDAIALFNSAGRITAINTCYANGQPIPSARVHRILGEDFSQLPIIQSCLRNSTTAPTLEFQTHCNITPALFDSTGLSVAYSVPVINPQNGAKLGVISSRLRFERLSSLIENRAIAGGSARAYFITDAGDYFSEAINSGREQPPVPVAELRDIAPPVLRDGAVQAVIHRGDKYLALFSLPGFQTIDGGGIHILIVADGHWLTQDPRQDRLVHAAGAGLIGTLLLIVAGLFHARLAAGRSRQVIEEANYELETAHTKLVDAARHAGMAEVAIGVLHNVGNVLTSVNVSATIVDEKLRRSKASGLAKVVAMLKEHEDDLAQFLEQDGKGREVLTYLEKLSQAIASERKDVLTELESLSKNVEHMKEVVNAQQSYATAVPLVETLNVRDLLEDALRINLMALGRHEIKVVRRYSDTHFISGDKHKILQILINLITNAKQAMSVSEMKILTLSTETGPTGEVLVSIRDTGCGIPAENMTRIFSHGFTTKTTGHGFGLHSSALTAKEMMGVLSVESRGAGQGATFTLELPLGRRANDRGLKHQLGGPTGELRNQCLLNI